MSVSYSQPPFQFTPKVRFEWIGESWKLFSSQAGAWIGAALLFILIGVAVWAAVAIPSGLWATYFDTLSQDSATRAANPFAALAVYTMPAYWILMLVMYLVSAFLGAGLLKMAVAQVRGQRISVGMLFSGGQTFLPLFGYTIMFMIFSLIGYIACLLPIFLVYAFFAPGFVLIADGVPFGEAMNRSVNGIKNDWLMAWLFAFVCVLIYAVGSVITIGIGIFALFPMGAIILALIYRDMIGMPGASPAGDPYNQPYGVPMVGPAQPGVWPPSPSASPAPGVYPPPYAPAVNAAPPPLPPAATDPTPGSGFQLPPTDPYTPPSEPEQNQGQEPGS